MKKDKRIEDRIKDPTDIKLSIIGFMDHKEYIPQKKIDCSIVDISESGIGIITNHQLEPGNVIKLDFKNTVLTGVVMWSMKTDSNVRAGIKFI
jgi:hypothetical protein